MSSNNNALTLKHILLGISESLNEAQNQLRNVKPYDEFGRPNTLYTLPYLDFNLMVEAEFENETTSQTTGVSLANPAIPSGAFRGGYGRTLAFKPVTTTTETRDTNTVTSTISGRFVAVLPNDGLPQLFINAEPKPTSDTDVFDIEVEVSNAAREKIADVLVEFNYDQEKTERLNPGATLSHGTTFMGSSEATTDSDGKTSAQVRVDSNDFANNHLLIFEVNVGNVRTKISIQK